MASDYRELGKRAQDPRFSEGIAIMNRAADDLRKRGLLPDTFHSSARENAEIMLEQARMDFKTEPHTPELMTNVFRKIWTARREFTHATFTVTDCPYTQEELDAFEKLGRKVSFLPSDLKGPANYGLLAKVFPKLRDNAIRRFETSVDDRVDISGWFTYVAPGPHEINPTDPQLKEINERVKTRKTLTHFIIAGYDNELLYGSYFNTKSITPIPGTISSTGQAIYAGFERDGSILIQFHSEVYPSRVKVPPPLTS